MPPIADPVSTFRRTPASCPGQWLYRFGEDGVVWSGSQHRFVGLDAAGVRAYLAFDAGAKLDDLLSLASSDHAACEALASIQALAHGAFPPEQPHEAWPGPCHTGKPQPANFAIHGIPIHIGIPEGPAGPLCQDVLRNLEIRPDPPPPNLPARAHLAAHSTPSGWTLQVNGRDFLAGLHAEQLGLAFLHAARALVYAEGRYDIAFHAAMVASRHRGVLLCAPRESGKSTLAAFLMAQGYRLATDEPALLNLETRSVSPLPLPVSLKQGSWEALAPTWPGLALAPVHRRSDGTRIRLLHPQHPDPQPAPLTHFVFPQYHGDSEPNTTRLSPFEALARLNEGGMVLSSSLSRQHFEAFLGLLSRAPAFVLRYASLEQAGSLLDAILDESQ